MTKDEAVSELLSRRELLAEYPFSDSAERRGRKRGSAWPPHLVIGKKIYYRRQSVERWLADQEQGTGQVVTFSAQTDGPPKSAESAIGQRPAAI